MYFDLINYSLKNLLRRKTRSLLTVVSILIGIMVIFALVSFGQGISKYVDDMFQKMGTDKLIVQPTGFAPPGSGSVTFDKDDIDFIKKIKGVDKIAGIMMINGEIKTKNDKKPKYPYIMGLATESDEIKLFEEIMTFKIENGRILKKGDKLNVVLGYNYQIPNKIFKKSLILGDKIIINGIEMEIVGFYEQVGNPDDDANFYLTRDGFKEIFNKEDKYNLIFIKAEENPTQLADKIQEKLRKRRNQKEGHEDFHVQTFEQLMETFGAIILVLNGVLFIIASISLIVAAVNIINTMYTSVLERTKEIGIMKAIGSRNSEIFFVFVIESGFLGLIGGSLGILCGYVIAKIGGLIAKYYGLSMLTPYFPWWLSVGCLAFAFLVGAGSGLLPAIQASKQKPVDALRYE